MLHTVTSVLIFTAALAAIVFVVRYARTQWNRGSLGRSTMALWLAFSLILGLAVSHEIWGDWLGRDVARLVTYALINIVLWSQVYQLFAGQRAARAFVTQSDPQHHETEEAPIDDAH